MKRVTLCIILVVLVSICSASLYAADNNAKTAQAKVDAPKLNTQVLQKPAILKSPTAPNMSMVVGSISRIDNTDPKNVKLEIKDPRDNQTHIVEMTPGTSLTKVMKISDLKAGDMVRVMSRKVQDKEVAMGVILGNFETMPRPPSQPKVQADIPQKAIQQESKAEQKK